MSLIDRWRGRIHRQHERDAQAERQQNVLRNVERDWVTSADIERLEEERVPWLRERRRQQRP